MSATPRQPFLSHAEPVLPVSDVAATIHYWKEVLAFPQSWVWGEPPTHGGVSWHGAFLQFSQNATRAKASAGNTVWIRVKYIDELYQLHTARKAEVVEPLQHQSWGLDEYVVKEVNGYHIVFSGHMAGRDKSGDFPASVKIEERLPTTQELKQLADSVGWTDSFPAHRLEQHLKAIHYGVVAVDSISGTTIGCALLLTDHASFYYIKDVMVKPEWQKQRVGTALMQVINQWLMRHAVKGALVGLYTGENLEPFYRQFGFGNAYGMCKRM